MIMKMMLNIDVLKEEPNAAEVIDGMISNPISLIEGLLNLPLNLPFTPFGKRMTAKGKCDASIYGLIERRLADNHDVGDILSILLSAEDENGNKITKKEVRDALVSLIVAGHETTTNTLIWTMYLLSEHPEVFEKARPRTERSASIDLPGSGHQRIHAPVSLRMGARALRG
jgi:cytochrome P450